MSKITASQVPAVLYQITAAVGPRLPRALARGGGFESEWRDWLVAALKSAPYSRCLGASGLPQKQHRALRKDPEIGLLKEHTFNFKGTPRVRSRVDLMVRKGASVGSPGEPWHLVELKLLPLEPKSGWARVVAEIRKDIKSLRDIQSAYTTTRTRNRKRPFPQASGWSVVLVHGASATLPPELVRDLSKLVKGRLWTRKVDVKGRHSAWIVGVPAF
jgi:hypothetical protein